MRSCDIGSAVPTPGFNLLASYIIHAVVPKWEDGTHQEYELLSSAYLSALKIADIMECNSIAFPLLASGHNGFSLDLAVQVALESFEAFEAENLDTVYLVIYDDVVSTFLKGKGITVNKRDELTVLTQPSATARTSLAPATTEIKEIAREIAIEVLNIQIQKAIKFLKQPANQQKIIAKGKIIVRKILHR